MIEELGLKVKKASKEVAKLSTADKNVFLQNFLLEARLPVKTSQSRRVVGGKFMTDSN